MKRVQIGIIFLLTMFLFVGFASATTSTLTTSSNSLSVTQGDTGIIQIHYSINNPVNNTGQNGVSYSGSPLFISSSTTSLSYLGNQTTEGDFNVNYNIPNNASGTVVNTITSDGFTLNIVFNIQQKVQSDIIVFPTSKVVTVQQGSQKSQNIIITVPQSYPKIVTIQSVDFNPQVEPIQFSDLNLGQIPPGQSLSIPIIFTGENAQTGIYSTNLNILATDSEGQVVLPSVNLQLQVTSGISPGGNSTFSNPPSCSLSSTEMSLNQTYSFTCSGVTNNIKVNVPYLDYYIGKSVDSSSGIYTYKFQPIKSGITNFISFFTYQGYSIFKKFNQQIKINPRSGTITDDSTKFQFYQLGQKQLVEKLIEGNVTVQVYDNNTGNLIPFQDLDGLYLNGNKMESNVINLKYGINYELRASLINQGYPDNTREFSLTPKTFNFSISPNEPTYYAGEKVTFSSDLSNVNYSINGNPISNPYELSSLGNITISASKSNYVNSKKELVVLNPPSIVSINEPQWSKGDSITLLISNSTTWKVFKDEVQISTGSGDTVRFTITDYGKYDVRVKGVTIASQTVENNGIWGWITDNLFLFIMVLVLLAVLSYFLFFKGKEKTKGFGEFAGPVGGN